MKINSINMGNEYKYNPELTRSYINTDRMTDLFIKTVKIDTGSKEENVGKKSPTTEGQIELGKLLSDELKSIGLKDVHIDKNGIVTGSLPSNTKNSPTIGFIAHLDTCSDVNTSNVKPIIHNYKAGDIKLKDNQVIKENELEKYKGHKIITSDGTSLLGADDKAGIAEIIEALRVFTEHPELKRPNIKVAFTPDEEIGVGIKSFDIKKFNADVAYTVDGSYADETDTENFNAYNPEITIKGVNVHTGFAYNKMVNAIVIANELINKLPKDERPENTKDREGFYCVDSISGNIDETKIKLLVRDFDANKVKEKINFIESIIEELKQKYPNAEINFVPNKKYINMKDNLIKVPQVIEYAKKGIELSGLEPKETIVRGGTDGSNLTERGLLSPNLGAGGINFHSKKEFVSVETMKKCCENIINIVQVWATNKNPFE